MKKYAIGLILLHYSFTYTDTRQEVFGRSFMFTRPAHFHLSTQQALWHNIMYTKKGPVFGALQIIGIYQQSSKIKKTARYFLINGKNKLVVSGDANIAERNTRDIRAEWLSLPDDFLGSFSLNPKQRQIAGILEYNQDLKRWFKDVKFLKDWWLSISAPIISVKNDLKLKQKIKRKGTPVVDGPQDIIEAFKQDAWCFSRIEGKKDKVGLAELRFTLGSKYIDQDYLQIGYYSIFIIPTAKKQDPEFIFSPVVGNDRHVGLGGGLTFQFPLNRDITDYAINFFVNLEGIFLTRNKQKRTFDLRDKPFSRFLLFNKEGGPPDQNIPGVNVLTFDAIVRPFGMFDFVVGWRYTTENLEIEFGYNLWGHDEETINFPKHRKPQNFRFGIAGDGPLNPDDPPAEQVASSASNSTIAKRAPNDTDKNNNPVFVPIRDNDIDLQSAASASALNHKIHFSIGGMHTGEKVDGFIGIGTFVDLPQKNSALRLWGVWAKAGATF